MFVTAAFSTSAITHMFLDIKQESAYYSKGVFRVRIQD
jgi:hypothetical protein